MVFAIHRHESAMGVHGCTGPPILNPLPPPSLPHPSGLSQSTSFGCPSSGIELALVICFTCGNIHVSVLFSQISHPHLFPQSPKVCSSHLCLFCLPAYRITITVFLNSIYIYIYTHTHTHTHTYTHTHI